MEAYSFLSTNRTPVRRSNSYLILLSLGISTTTLISPRGSVIADILFTKDNFGNKSLRDIIMFLLKTCPKLSRIGVYRRSSYHERGPASGTFKRACYKGCMVQD